MVIWSGKGEKRGRVWDICLFAAALGFYLFFAFYDGPVWTKDSLSYASMNITREPLYPTFLWLFRQAFGEESYLMPVIIAQSILAAYAAWKLAMTVKEYKILCLLVINHGRVLTYDWLYEKIWNEEPIGSVSNAIACHIHNLREKILKVLPHPRFSIRCVREIGYCLEINSEQAT